MNRNSIGRRLAGTLVTAIALAVLVPASAYAEDNDCKAVVKFLNATAEGSGTKFTFDVKTGCDASMGSFEYSFKVKGKEQIRNSPAWTPAEGKSFLWTDNYSAPVAEISDVKTGKVKSTNVQAAKAKIK